MSMFRRFAVLALSAAVLATAAPPMALAAPKLGAQAGALAPDAEALELAGVMIDAFFTPETMAGAFKAESAPAGLPPAWMKMMVEAATEEVTASRPQLMRMMAEVIVERTTPAEREAAVKFFRTQPGKDMLAAVTVALESNKDPVFSDSVIAGIQKAGRNPDFNSFIDKLEPIANGFATREADLMRLWAPGIFRRFGEKAMAVPRAPLTAEQKLGSDIARLTVDGDSFRKALDGPMADAILRGLSGHTVPAEWGDQMKLALTASVDRHWSEFYDCVGLALARRMSGEDLRATLAFLNTLQGREVAAEMRKGSGQLKLSPAAQKAFDAFIKTPAGRSFKAANDAASSDSEQIGMDFGMIILPEAFLTFGKALEAQR